MTKKQIAFLSLLGIVLVGSGMALGWLVFSDRLQDEGDRLQEEAVVQEEQEADEQIEQPFEPNPTPPSGGAQALINHDTYITFSDDPESFADGELVTESASVPEVLVCTVNSDACGEDEILIYFVDPLNETNSMEGISLVRSTDGGETWSEREPISISGKTNKGPAVDPSLVQLSDGTFRMYFFGPDKPFGGPADSENVSTTENPVYSAVSEDGVNFTMEEGVRLTVAKLTDPDVVLMGETWIMYYSVGPQSGVAVSDDGLEFEDQGVIDEDVGGVPGAMVLTDGTVRLYGCSPQGGIVVSESEDGIEFERIQSVFQSTAGGTCDPSPAAFGDEFVFVYKKIAL